MCICVSFYLSSTHKPGRPESYTPADKDSRTGEVLDVGMHGLEPPGNAKKSDGFFENGILKAMASDAAGQKETEIKVIGNGHCHCEFISYMLEGLSANRHTSNGEL